jgi:hypothetical protein
MLILECSAAASTHSKLGRSLDLCGCEKWIAIYKYDGRQMITTFNSKRPNITSHTTAYQKESAQRPVSTHNSPAHLKHYRRDPKPADYHSQEGIVQNRLFLFQSSSARSIVHLVQQTHEIKAENTALSDHIIFLLVHVCCGVCWPWPSTVPYSIGVLPQVSQRTSPR